MTGHWSYTFSSLLGGSEEGGDLSDTTVLLSRRELGLNIQVHLSFFPCVSKLKNFNQRHKWMF